MVSTNDLSGDGVKALAERAVAMARVAPEDRYAGLADPALLAQELSRSRPGRPRAAGRRRAGSDRAPRRGGRPRGQGRQQVGRRLGLGRHRRHGAADQPRLLRRLSRLAPQRRRCRRSPARAPAWSPTTISPRRCTPPISTTPEKIGRTAGEQAVARLNPRKVSTRKVPVVFDRRVAGSIVGHLVSAINGSVDRAQDELPQGQARRADVRAGHQHHRRSAAPPRACARGRSTPRASPAGAWR